MKVLNIFLLTSLIGLTGCFESDSENALEDMGEQVSETAEDVTDSMEDTADDIGDAADDAADDIEDSM